MSNAHDLDRFVAAQSRIWPSPLQELRQGLKRTHWMWYVFPQLEGLGSSPMSRRFAISGLAEASAYLAHTLLGRRLEDATDAMLGHDDTAAYQILGTPDDLKFWASMTLFGLAAPEKTYVSDALDAFFRGRQHPQTLEILQISPASGLDGSA